MTKKLITVLSFLIILILTGCQEKINLDEINPRNEIIYQVFVRSFADSDGDGIGDINGLIDKLDYLEELGITAIYLMPIFPSPSYHGYDVTDYYDINEDYGSLEDFKNLLKETNKRGQKVILDLVVNHSSSEHPWFQAALAGDENYRSYYVFHQTKPSGLGSWNQNIWHGTAGNYYCGYFDHSMPDFNMYNDEVIDEIYRICDFWIDLGVAGFRLDAAQHFFGYNEYPGTNYDYYQNVIFLQDLKINCLKKNSDFYLLGEVNEKIHSVIGEYFKGIHSPLDFPISNLLVETATTNSRGYLNNLLSIYDTYQGYNHQFISAPFLRNHDQDRIATLARGDIKKLKFASEMLLTLPGSPIIYYGEELGMYGVKSSGELSMGKPVWDETRRLPFKFGDEYETTWFQDEAFISVINNKDIKNLNEQMEDLNSLYHTYQRLIHLRNSTPALKYGNNFLEYEEGSRNLQGFYRTYQYRNFSQTVLVLHNFSNEEVPMISYLGQIIYASDEGDYTKLTKIAPRSTVIIEVKEEDT